MTIWTNDDRREWDALLRTPLVIRALAHLQERCRVKGKPQELAPGYDALVIAALGYAQAQGQSSVFEAIEEIAKPVTERKPLGPEFERTPPPKKT